MLDGARDRSKHAAAMFAAAGGPSLLASN